MQRLVFLVLIYGHLKNVRLALSQTLIIRREVSIVDDFKCLQDLRFLQLGHLRIIASAVK